MPSKKFKSELALFIRALTFSFCVFAPVVLINFLQILSLVLKPISPVAFRQYNSFWAACYWSYTGWAARVFGGLRIEFSGERIIAGENAIVLANHQSAVDIIVQLAFGQLFGRLGDMKFFVKDILKYVPGPGWGMIFLDCIFMKRNWTADRSRVLEQLQKFIKHRTPVLINIYAEGTRLRSNKLALAQEFARAHGMPRPENVLIPKVKGFQATLEGLKGHLDAVYDLTIVYPEEPPTLWDLLSGQGPRVKVEYQRFPIAELPVESDAQGIWLLELYQAKDRQIERMRKSF